MEDFHGFLDKSRALSQKDTKSQDTATCVHIYVYICINLYVMCIHPGLDACIQRKKDAKKQASAEKDKAAKVMLGLLKQSQDEAKAVLATAHERSQEKEREKEWKRQWEREREKESRRHRDLEEEDVQENESGEYSLFALALKVRAS